jgi:DinB superfamily
VLDHLTKAYEVLLNELSGRPGMGMLTKRPVQWLLSFTMLPKILAGKYFPEARAPKETRPDEIQSDPSSAVDRFQRLAHEFHKKVQATYNNDPKLKLTHAYFGRMNLTDIVLLIARHIQHHHRQIS